MRLTLACIGTCLLCCFADNRIGGLSIAALPPEIILNNYLQSANDAYVRSDDARGSGAEHSTRSLRNRQTATHAAEDLKRRRQRRQRRSNRVAGIDQQKELSRLQQTVRDELHRTERLLARSEHLIQWSNRLADKLAWLDSFEELGLVNARLRHESRILKKRFFAKV